MSAFMIAEVGQNHDGSLGLAHAFIDAVAKTGVDAIKFQTHIAQAESTPGEAFRISFSYEDSCRYDYWKRMEWSLEQWRELKQHAEEKKLTFLSSPFSIEAVEMLEKINIVAWKVGSGETRSAQLLERIAKTGKPIYLSTGMSSYSEIDEVVKFLEQWEAPLTLLQCTTQYPCPADKIGLNVIQEYQKRYRLPVGFSDHSGTIYPSFAAVTLGASAIEVHVTLSNELFGPDIRSSITTQELSQLVEGVRMIERILEHPIDKDKASTDLTGLKQLFGKGTVALRALPEGTCLSLDDVRFKKPANGILEWNFRQYLGMQTTRNIGEGESISREDLNL